MSGDILKDPFGPDVAMPRIEHAVVDEQMQIQQYLADIALEDLRLLPDPSARRVRPGSLLDSYNRDVAARHAVEALNEIAPVEEVVVEEVYRSVKASVPAAGVSPPDDKVAREFTKLGE